MDINILNLTYQQSLCKKAVTEAEELLKEREADRQYQIEMRPVLVIHDEYEGQIEISGEGLDYAFENGNSVKSYVERRLKEEGLLH